VSDARRAAVLEAAAHLGYRPNAAARSLVQRRTNVIGVMVSDLHNPFFAEVVDGMESVAGPAGLRILMNSGLRQPEREQASIDALLEMRSDALILTAPQLPARLVAKAARSVPVVMIATSSDGEALDSVAVDDQVGARLAVEHLHALGHSRIAHIDGHGGPGEETRRSGYEIAMRGLGLADEILVATGGHTEADGYRAAHELIATDPRPTAIFAFNDVAALGAMTAIEEHGLTIPGDMSLVGYDNTRLSGLGHIDLTTIDQPRFDMGSRAVSMAIERIEKQRTNAESVVLVPRLVPRGTTAPPSP
jgi:DNA-binding LacI/PurR family transcriptional regulator